MYWKKTATNNDWNDPANWVKENGTSFGFDCVPWKCTVVHIPGNANKYPSLNPEITKRSLRPELFDGSANNAYNEGKSTPCCDDIIYHFGAEAAKPHYLDYNRAFVHYNFGQNTNDANKGQFTCGDVSTEAVGTHSASFLIRDRYYAMAAPLKQIVTGDFSLGGFPKMWQQGFKSSRSSETGDTRLVGNWYLPNNKMSLEVGATMNYAVSLMAFGYDLNAIGKKDHANLNALNGYIVLPYFEGTDEIKSRIESKGSVLPGKSHRLHWFEKTTSAPVSGTSHFAYYYDSDLRMADIDVHHDIYPRNYQAYRFIFENENDVPVENFTISVPAEKVGAEVPDVMVGNPFISSLDIETFIYLNSSRLANDTYRLYKNGQFETQLPEDADYGVVAPLQAIFIQPVEGIGSPKETGLIFTKAMSITREGGAVHQLRFSLEENDHLTIRATNAIGSSRAVLAFSNPTGRKDIDRMFSNDVPGMPQVYLLNQGQKKEVLYLSGASTSVIPLGIRSNALEEFTLSFENVSNLPVESLQLKDKELGRMIDLLEKDSYTFKNSSGNLSDRFELIIRNAYTDMDNITQAQVRIHAKDHILYAFSDLEMVEIQITNIQGVRFVSEILPRVL